MASDDKNEAKAPESRGRRRFGRWMIALLGIAALGLGFYIYSGIRGRLEAASILTRVTEQAAVSDVAVVHPKQNPPLEEITLPGGTQPYMNSPIFARTNGYLVNWYFDIGARVKKGDLLALIDTPEVNK